MPKSCRQAFVLQPLDYALLCSHPVVVYRVWVVDDPAEVVEDVVDVVPQAHPLVLAPVQDVDRHRNGEPENVTSIWLILMCSVLLEKLDFFLHEYGKTFCF